MNGTRCAIRPDANATSRESLSSLETVTLHLATFAIDNAAASCGRRSSASAPCLGLDELSDDLDLLGLCEPHDGCTLRFYSEAGAVLLLCGDTIVGNRPFHTNCIPPFAVCM